MRRLFQHARQGSARLASRLASAAAQPTKRTPAVGFGIETPLLLVFSGVVATSVMRSLAQRHVSDASFSSSAPAEHEVSKEEEEPSVTTGAHLEDRYEVGDVIGCGHFATVRRGVHRESGEAVAIKTIAKSRTDASTIRREIAIQRMVGSHENMVGLRDFFETESEWIIVMELVTGGELFERLVTQGPYSEKEASRLMRQLAQGVAWLHQNGICHRDLKPENLLLSEPDGATGEVTVKICDFGLSVILKEEDGDILQEKQGTWAYWAPEMFATLGYGKQVDLWSLGVIMYILLAGQHPFDAPGRTDAQMRQNIQAGQLSFAHEQWNAVSEEAKQLIRALLRHEPRERMSSEMLLTQAWIKGTGVSEVPIRGSDTNLKEYQRMRKKWSTALVASMHKQAVIRKRLSDRRVPPPLPTLPHSVPVEEADANVEARELLADAFQVFDPEGKGYVAATDLAGVIQRLGQQMTPAEVSHMVSAMDEGGSGKIYYQQYLNMAATTIKEKETLFREGDVIFREGDPSDFFYLITSGRVRRLTRPPPERFEAFVAAEEELGAGDYFGTSAILGSGERKRHSTMIAMTEVRVVRLGRDDFEPEHAVGDDRSSSDPEHVRRRMTSSTHVVPGSAGSPSSSMSGSSASGSSRGGSSTSSASSTSSTSGTSSTSSTSSSSRSGLATAAGVGSAGGERGGSRNGLATAAASAAPLIPNPAAGSSGANRDGGRSSADGDSAHRDPHHTPENSLMPPRRPTANASRSVLRSLRFIRMMSNNEQRRYAKGEHLFREGEDARHMFIITSGRVQVACEGKDGRRYTIGQRGAGECCGETSCLSRSTRNSTVTCVSDEGCECMCIRREDFLALVRGSWDVAQDLVAVSERHKKEKARRVNFLRTRDEVDGEDDDF